MADPFEEIIQFAKDKEEEAAAFYEMAAGITKDPMRTVFKDLASVERGHRQMLENWSREAVLEREIEKAADLKISEYLVDVSVRPEMGYQEVLIVAMKREEKALALYSNLAQLSNAGDTRQLFQALAQQEAEHKRRLETEYDEVILSED